MENAVQILMTEFVTHDVKRFILEKPEDLQFTPGQATEISINKPEWEDKQRPFTFTCRNKDKVLEFTIKSYPEHNGVTEKLHQLVPGDELIIRDPFGTINYQDTGTFIAGGAGITPFIAILRDLRDKGKLQSNKLFFSNKKSKDVILEKEFREMFPKENLVLTLTKEDTCGYDNRYIDKNFLEKEIEDFSQNFYVCGPPAMVRDMKKYLNELGASTESVVFEGKN
ncbi:MAG: FAD-binding oxidoreductase [Patescibacteria group bacterium]